MRHTGHTAGASLIQSALFHPTKLFRNLQNFELHRFLELIALALRMLYFIGLGLADEKDISVKGLEIVKNAERVYLEAYTAILLVKQDQLV
jgi:hypothetical protein